MKNHLLIIVCVITFFGFLVGCSFNETPLHYLKNKEQRSVVIKQVALSPEYRTEMMDELMANDSSKLWVVQYLMHHKMMMNDLFDLTAKDSLASQILMAKTIEMCDGNSEKCKMLMGTMSLYPSVMSYTNKNYCTPKSIN